MALETITASDLARVVRVYTAALKEHREALNRLNVYPVPDGDTGTNMGLTLEAVQKELDQAGPPDITAVAQALSHGSLMGARGNSGVILSQILRGMATSFKEALPASGASRGPGRSRPSGSGLGGQDLAEALSRASFSAYGAVSNPVEGTILTVARAAAKGAAAALSANVGSSLVQVLDSARQDAAKALAGTTEQLSALKAAGVVDAGGAGLLLLLDSFLHVADGREIAAPPPPANASTRGIPAPGTGTAPGTGATPGTGAAADEGRERKVPENGVGDLRYEVMFFLDASDEAIPAFRSVWRGYGGSIVIVGGEGLYNCHIHTDDIGGAIEAAIEIGRPWQIRVTDLAEQVEEERWVREAVESGDQQEIPADAVTTAVVAVSIGEGIKRIFRSLGVQQVVAGGQSANPSTKELLDAIAVTSAEQVVVLPNNPNVIAVAEQAASCSTKKVRVVPTAGIPEGFAALLEYDPEADVDTNADNMAAAAARVLSGEIAQASRDAVTDAGAVREGDWLGISREGVKVVVPGTQGPVGAAMALLALLVAESGDHEIVTIIEGEGAHAAETRRIVGWLSEQRPGVTAEVHHGGQPLYPYLFSIE
ncbi:MAG TPA: DAK2 domain-containing protein [Acidimicrobiales bacterium]|nr:DAK2 domain-containing protein [Acidimicrobiales bacterium]